MRPDTLLEPVNRRTLFGLSVVVGVAVAATLIGAESLLYPPTAASEWPCGPGPPPNPTPIGPGPYEMGTAAGAEIGGQYQYNSTVLGGWCGAAWGQVSFGIQYSLGGPNLSTTQSGWNLTIHNDSAVVATYDIRATPSIWTTGAAETVRSGESIVLTVPPGVSLAGDYLTAIINLGQYGGSVSSEFP